MCEKKQLIKPKIKEEEILVKVNIFYLQKKKQNKKAETLGNKKDEVLCVFNTVKV